MQFRPLQSAHGAGRLPASAQALVWRRAFILVALIAAVFSTGCGRRKGGVRASSPRPRVARPAEVRPVGSVEMGYASWYGNPYHGRATSSGEIYDMHQMTAAHRTLAFGTVVEVRNLENGRKTRVRINDRGPFIDGRIIDLSLTAAREISMVGPGTALVEMKVVSSPEAAALPPGRSGAGAGRQPAGAGGGFPPAATGTPAVSGRYTVQVGAFADVRNAERLRGDLARRYPQFPVNTAPTPDGSRHRVWVGSEQNEDAAAAVAERLRRDQVTAFVVRLD